MQPIVYSDIFNELCELKREIDKEPDKWEYRKRAINPYECIFHNHYNAHTTWRSQCPSVVSLSAIKPISRAFFKMSELSKVVRLDEHVRTALLEPIRILHIAESPGGFVQSWRWHREQEGFIDDALCVSISSGNGTNPWNRLSEISRSWVHPPQLRVGNILDVTTQHHIDAYYSDYKAFIVTADGGFDFSDDYCKQEEQAIPLITAEVKMALRNLAEGGVFIVKVFDTVTLPMIRILWIIWKYFRSFKMYKPRTSRMCNSEKYIIAIGFKGYTDDIWDNLETSFDEMDPAFMAGLPWIKKHMQTQINTIRSALSIDPDEPDESRLDREEKSIKLSRQWCNYHSIPINTKYINVYAPPSSGRYNALLN